MFWASNLLAQNDYFLNIALGQRLRYNYEKNLGIGYLRLANNAPLKRDFGYNKLSYHNFSDYIFGLQFNRERKKCMYEIGISTDGMSLGVKITALTKNFANDPFVHGASNNRTNRRLANLSFKCNFKLKSQEIKFAHLGVKTKLILFTVVDLISPLMEHFERGIFAVDCISDNLDTIAIRSEEQ